MPVKPKKVKTYKYTFIEYFEAEGHVNVYGVVTSILKEPGGNLLIEIKDESRSIPVRIWERSTHFFSELMVYDIIRLHRSQIRTEGSKPYLTFISGLGGNHAMAWGYTDTSTAAKLATAENNTFTDQDEVLLKKYREFAMKLANGTAVDINPKSNAEIYEEVRQNCILANVCGLDLPEFPITLDQAERDMLIKIKEERPGSTICTQDMITRGYDENGLYFNFFAQVLGVYKTASPDGYVVRVWDGTPQLKKSLFRVSCGDAKNAMSECDSETMNLVLTDSTDVLCFGSSWKSIMEKITPGQVVLFANAHFYSRTMGELALSMHENQHSRRCIAILPQSHGKFIAVTSYCDAAMDKLLARRRAPETEDREAVLASEAADASELLDGCGPMLPNELVKPLRLDSDTSIKSFTLANVQAQSSPLPTTKTTKFNYEGINMGSASQFLREMEQDSLDAAGETSEGMETEKENANDAENTFRVPAVHATTPQEVFRTPSQVPLPGPSTSRQNQRTRREVLLNDSHDSYLDGPTPLSRNDVNSGPIPIDNEVNSEQVSNDGQATASEPAARIEDSFDDFSLVMEVDIPQNIVINSPQRTDPVCISEVSDDDECDVMSTIVNRSSDDSSQEEPMPSTRDTPIVMRKRKSSEFGEESVIPPKKPTEATTCRASPRISPSVLRSSVVPEVVTISSDSDVDSDPIISSDSDCDSDPINLEQYDDQQPFRVPSFPDEESIENAPSPGSRTFPINLKDELSETVKRVVTLSLESKLQVCMQNIADVFSGKHRPTLEWELQTMSKLPPGSIFRMQNWLHIDRDIYTGEFLNVAITWVAHCSTCNAETTVARRQKGWCQECFLKRQTLNNVIVSVRVKVPCQSIDALGGRIILEIHRDQLVPLLPKESCLTHLAVETAFSGSSDDYLSWKARMLVAVKKLSAKKEFLASTATVLSVHGLTRATVLRVQQCMFRSRPDVNSP